MSAFNISPGSLLLSVGSSTDINKQQPSCMYDEYIKSHFASAYVLYYSLNYFDDLKSFPHLQDTIMVI